jgi:hypothetical protein
MYKLGQNVLEIGYLGLGFFAIIMKELIKE